MTTPGPTGSLAADPPDAAYAVDPALARRLLRHLVVGPGADRITTYGPFDGRPLVELPVSSPDDVASAFAVARRAQRRWAEIAPWGRADVLLRFHDLVLDRQAEGLDLAQAETGKSRLDAFEELIDLAVTARHYARVGPRLLRPRRRTGAFLALTQVRELHHPKGVVGIISPWNYPLTLAVGDAIPALLAGNAVVLKPDQQTTLTALWAVDLLREAGVPDGALSVVAGPGAEVGPPADRRAPTTIMFTGSTRVGREVAKRCGERLIGCSLELGGKNALIVRRGRRPRPGRRHRGPGRLRQLRAAVRRRPSGCTSTRPSWTSFLAAVRRRASARCGSARRRLGSRHGLARLRRAAGRASERTSTTPWRRAPSCSPVVGPGPTSARTSSSRRSCPP